MGGRRRGIPEAEILRAIHADPTALIESRGLKVTWEGRHARVTHNGRELYRLTRKDDGRHVACNHDGEGIGDSIALARLIDPRLTFPEAVAQLSKAVYVTQPTTPRRTESRSDQGTFLFFPPDADRDNGRAYLISARGIESSVLDDAERAQAIGYAQGQVVFFGRDGEGRIRNGSVRSTGGLTPAWARTWNLIDSDKRWPVVFPGNTALIWLVEGGVDGLAVQSVYHRAGRAAPSVVVSGGVRVVVFLERATDETRTLMRAAKTIWIARDRESCLEIQAGADKGHERQKAALEGLVAGSGAVIKIWEPPKGFKDIADYAKVLAERCGPSDNAKRRKD